MSDNPFLKKQPVSEQKGHISETDTKSIDQRQRIKESIERTRKLEEQNRDNPFVNKQPQSRSSGSSSSSSSGGSSRSSGSSSSSSGGSSSSSQPTPPVAPDPTPTPEPKQEPKPYHTIKDRSGNVQQSFSTKSEYESYLLAQAKQEALQKGREYIQYRGRTLFTQSKGLSPAQRAAVGQVQSQYDRRRLEDYAEQKNLAQKRIVERKGNYQTTHTVYVDRSGREIGRVSETKFMRQPQAAAYVYDPEKKQTRPATPAEMYAKGPGQSIDPFVVKAEVERSLRPKRQEAPVVAPAPAEKPQSTFTAAPQRNIVDRAKDLAKGVLNRFQTGNVASGLNVQNPVTAAAKSDFLKFNLYGALNAAGYVVEGKMSVREGASKIYQDLIRKPLSDPIANMVVNKETEIVGGRIVNQKDITLSQVVQEKRNDALAESVKASKSAMLAESVFFGSSAINSSINPNAAKNNNDSNNNFANSGSGVGIHDSQQSGTQYKNVFNVLTDFGTRAANKPQEFKNLIVAEAKSVSAYGKSGVLGLSSFVVTNPGEVLVGATFALPVISAGAAAVQAVAGPTGAALFTKATGAAGVGLTIFQSSNIENPAERRAFIGENLVVDAIFLGGQKAVDTASNVYRRAGTKFVDPTEVFDSKVLKGDATFPTANNVDDAVEAFRQSKKEYTVTEVLSPEQFARKLSAEGKLDVTGVPRNMPENVAGLYFWNSKTGKPTIAISNQRTATTMAHELIHYKTVPTIKKTPVLNVLEDYLPYRLKPSEVVAYGLEKRFTKTGFKSQTTKQGIAVTHAAPNPLKSNQIGAGPAGARNLEDAGLYVTPAGRGSPHFLGLSPDAAETQITYSIFPQARRPRVVRVGAQDVKRIPEELIQVKGFEESNVYLQSQAGSGNVFITKRSEIGMRGLQGKGAGTNELEAVIPQGANIERQTSTVLGKIKGYDQVTEFRGTVVPIEDYNIMTGAVTPQQSTRQVSAVEKALSSSSYEYLNTRNQPVGSVLFVSASEPPEGYYDNISSKNATKVSTEIPEQPQSSPSQPTSGQTAIIPSSSSPIVSSEPSVAVSSVLGSESKKSSKPSSSQSISTSEALSMLSEGRRASSAISQLSSKASSQASSAISRISSPSRASRVYSSSSPVSSTPRRTPPSRSSRPPRLPRFNNRGNQFASVFSSSVSRKGVYTPSVTALIFGIKGKKSKKSELTGLGFRPIDSNIFK